VDSAEARFGGLGARSPVLLPRSGGRRAEIEMAAHAAVIYLREIARLAADERQSDEVIRESHSVERAA
jgi:hypothetical protein